MVVQATRLPGKVHILPAALETTRLSRFPAKGPGTGEWSQRDLDARAELGHLALPTKLRTDWPGRGPMTITGPVFVNTAEPGDVLQIKINKIVARPWGANFNVPGLFGQFPKEFPDGQVK
jgi:hypothetical protein